MLLFSNPCRVIVQSTTPSPGLALATCNSSLCKTSATFCSSNLDCECFSLTNTVNGSISGICAIAALPCSSMIRCNSDNITCSIAQTICVNSTRCQKPVCYPMALAYIQICPPNRITTMTPTVTTSSTRAANTTVARNATTTSAIRGL
ncbi:unnamed protein product [Rotaria sp. Silwood2]|nr:unnamed protein product [Rotaria sp. Silwood2]CAF4090523.1 unnamed protein product [Rotaria sp. Silwood2]